MAVCKYHPDRPAIGLCMRCRAAICAACCTRLDGINHCHACLQALGRPETTPSRGRWQRLLAPALVLGLSWLFLTGLLWLIEGKLAP